MMIKLVSVNCALLSILLLLFLIIITDCQKPKVSKDGINLISINRRNPNTKNNNTGTKRNKGFLSVKNGNLFYKNRTVFLSGANLLYNTLGKDFGFGNYNNVKSMFESYLKQISDSGGNAVRVQLFATGVMFPQLDSGGFATGADTASLIQEMGQFLDAAKRNNVFVIINLWSGYDNYSSINAQNLYTDESKLTSYIEKVLKPLAYGLKSKKALAMYDIVSDPSGSIANNIVDSNKCYDTQYLFHQIASFSNNNFTMNQMQRFINRQIAAIKTADPKTLCTVNTKEEEGSRFCDWCYNYWQNKCLISAGGKSKGVLDVVSYNAFAFGDDYYWSPLKKKAADYKLGKPVIIGLASAKCSIKPDAITISKWAFNNGYSGVFNWRYSPGSGFCVEGIEAFEAAMNYLRNKKRVKIKLSR